MADALYLKVDGATDADRLRAAQELLKEIRIEDPDIHASLMRDDPEAGDLGPVLAIVLSAFSVAALANGVRNWLLNQKDRRIEFQVGGETLAVTTKELTDDRLVLARGIEAIAAHAAAASMTRGPARIPTVTRAQAVVEEHPALREALKSVLANPVEDAPREAYAKECDKVNDPRGRLIRVQIKLLNAKKRDIDAEDERSELLKLHAQRWAAGVAGSVERWEFDRGFVGLVRLPAEKFLATAADLYSKAPILHLELTDAKKSLADLCRSQHMARIRSLDLSRSGLDDESMRLIADSPMMSELRWLALAYNRVDTFGAKLLAASKHLKNLRFVRLAGNPSNPCERIADDQGIIVDRWLPPEGEIIEQRLGRVAWFHYDWATTTQEVTPDPIAFSRT